MPYAEAFTQRLILSYFLVEFLNTLNESVECFICKAILIIDKVDVKPKLEETKALLVNKKITLQINKNHKYNNHKHALKFG